MYRTHQISEVIAVASGTVVQLCGWVHRVRDLGGVCFVELRDRSGVIQLVGELLSDLKSEWVVSVKGVLQKRESANVALVTGEWEVAVTDCEVLNQSLPLPFLVNDTTPIEDTLQMTYRYLMLRKSDYRDRLMLRHRLVQAVRGLLNDAGFLDIETPILTKSTPEGARDFVVPSRIHEGSCFALPQSPQLFKQLLMVAGFEKYYQIVKCFRDEDLRADRQPEFTQIDIEQSFVTESDIMHLTNTLVKRLFEVAGLPFPEAVPIMSYQDAMHQYGSDRPDLRNPLCYQTVTDMFADTAFNVFRADCVKLLCVPGGADRVSRRMIDDWTVLVKEKGLGGLAWGHVLEGEFKSPIAKFLSDTEIAGICDRATVGDTVLFLVGAAESALYEAMHVLREAVSDALSLRSDGYRLLWVNRFPLFERDEHGCLTAVHHPFTAPRESDVPFLETDPAAVISRAYDMVLNGVELGGGSIRIHDPDRQRQVFRLLGMSDAAIEAQFGFFMTGLSYGAPPHGGIALGLDRLVMLLTGAGSIREVMAFPKTTQMSCLLTGAPSKLSAQQKDLQPHFGVSE